MPQSSSPSTLQNVQQLLGTGKKAAALTMLAAWEQQSQNDMAALQQIGQLYTATNQHVAAARAFARAAALAPNHPTCLYNLATARIALGELDEAERLFDRVLAIAPHDYDAYYNRATLRKQKPTGNHVAEMERLIAQPLRNANGAVQLGYALAKELEDLGESKRSFSYLKQGADARRKLLSYRVESDVETMAEIAQAFDASLFAHPQKGFASDRPIFILGLPRSGTTLVDRILSSHSAVGSLGEIQDFPLALVRLAGGGSRSEFIRRSTTMDFAALGEAYCSSSAGTAKRLIDKTPLNFLYIGLIALALPNAKIVHVRRGAMDVCYAMYKTLFRMAYPFSYALDDLGRYYLAYHGLMAHWRKILPGRLLEVDYEDLVARQEDVSRRLVAQCDLAWEDACLSFERNASPSFTASAAQVRQPIYASSIGLWRQHAKELAPLADILRQGGIAVESEI